MNDLLVEYDNILIGKRQMFSDVCFGSNKTKCTKSAIEVMRYAFSKYLRWSPDAISSKMTRQIMDKLKLQPLMKFIDYPVEYDKEKDYFYLVSIIYGGRRITLRDRTIHIYERIMSGNRSKFPVDYFIGSDGMVHAGICLQYVINNYLYFTSLNEMYAFFACEDGYAFLREHRLLNACRDSFETPVDFLHFALPKHQRNQFYFYYYKFKYMREMVTESGRKRQGQTKYILKGDDLP